MNCTSCGSDLAPGFAFCPTCGVAVGPAGAAAPPASTGDDSFENLVRDVGRSAERATATAVRVSARVLRKTDSALVGAPDTARRTLRRVRTELDRIESDLEQLLKHLP
jgi:hypothetical protein